MKNLQSLYDTNELFKKYVDKFATAYHLIVEEALQCSIVGYVSEEYTPKLVK